MSTVRVSALFPQNDDVAMRSQLADLVPVHGIVAVMRAMSDACDVEAELADDQATMTSLVGVAIQVRILADDVEEILGVPSTVREPMPTATEIVDAVRACVGADQGGE